MTKFRNAIVWFRHTGIVLVVLSAAAWVVYKHFPF